jgi:hypothetical protein
MDKFAKGHLTVNGNELHMSVPFAKVDKEKRTVSGFATLDNVDSQKDIVKAEASARAFARGRGNLREMHDKIAAGRLVDFREDEYFDPETNKTYKGIFVTAYVSKGAPTTWEKCLDGTLQGFSIGGEINKASHSLDKSSGDSVRVIEDYDLTELSLVDNPANQLANISSIQKVFSIDKSNGSVNGMVADTKVESVFICNNDSTVIIKESAKATCPQCDSDMENAGWFESGEDRTEKVREIVSKFRNPNDMGAALEIAKSEGGVEEVSKKVEKGEYGDETPVPEGTETEVVNPTEEFPDGEKVDENAKPENRDGEDVNEVAGTEEEEANSPDEVHDDETEIAKKLGELHEVIEDSLEKTRSETKEQISELEKKLNSAHAELTDKVSELDSKIAGFSEKQEALKNKQASLEKALGMLNDAEALKKSAELDEVRTVEKKEQKWTPGAFSPRASRFTIDSHL